MNKEKLPHGWDVSLVQRVAHHYETQTEDQAVAEAMDRVSKYGEIVKRLLRHRESIARPSLPDGI